MDFALLSIAKFDAFVIQRILLDLLSLLNHSQGRATPGLNVNLYTTVLCRRNWRNENKEGKIKWLEGGVNISTLSLDP